MKVQNLPNLSKAWRLAAIALIFLPHSYGAHNETSKAGEALVPLHNPIEQKIEKGDGWVRKLVPAE